MSFCISRENNGYTWWLYSKPCVQTQKTLKNCFDRLSSAVIDSAEPNKRVAPSRCISYPNRFIVADSVSTSIWIQLKPSITCSFLSAGISLPEETSANSVTCHPAASLQGLWMSCSGEERGIISTSHSCNFPPCFQQQTAQQRTCMFSLVELFLLTLCFLHFMEKFSSMRTQSARTRMLSWVQGVALTHQRGSTAHTCKVQTSGKS